MSALQHTTAGAGDEEDQLESSGDESSSDVSDVDSASVSDDRLSRTFESEEMRTEKRRKLHNTKWLLDDTLDWNSQLCEACQRWNACIPDMSDTSGIDSATFESVTPITMRQWKSVGEILGERNCILCKAFQPTIQDKVKALSAKYDDGHRLHCVNTGPFYFCDPKRKDFREACQVARSIKCDFVILIDTTPQVVLKEALLLVQSDQWSTPPNSRPLGFLVFRLRLHYESEQGGLNKVEHRDLTFLDIPSVRDLLSHCETSHADCQGADNILPHGFRLVDIQDMCIVQPKLKRTVSFAALSYVWSAVQDAPITLRADNFQDLFETASLTTMALPSLLEDTFVLCSELGIRYLWVDRLCIVQDDPKDLELQIDAMDQIYSAAKVTIVAAANADSGGRLAGVIRSNARAAVDTALWRWRYGRLVGETPDHVIWSSDWNKRGWTFQERELSRRCIYVCDHRCYFFCGRGIFEEDRDDVCPPGPLSSDYDYRDTGLAKFGASTSMLRLGKFDSFHAWETRLSDYVSRSLSHDTDILRAFQGYSNYAARQLRTRIFFGLPEKWFSKALVWNCPNVCSRRDNVAIPSWSWAAWMVPRLDHDIVARAYPRPEIIRLPIEFKLNSNGHSLSILRQNGEEQHDNMPIMQSDGDPMFFESTYHAWRKSAHNNQYVKDLKQTKECVAEGIPGSLVFGSQAAGIKICCVHSMEASRHGKATCLATICDPHSNEVVGGLRYMNNLDEASWPFMSDQYTAVAISGSGGGIHFTWSHTGWWPWTEYWDWKEQPLVEQSLFFSEDQELYEYYQVMILQPHQVHAGVYERVATGLIWRRKWRQLRPEWETIVLA